MNKSSKRWKVFVLVLCLLFTMTPATVFADGDGQADPLTISPPINDGGNPPDPGTPPDNTTLPGITDPVTPPDNTTLPGITDPVTPPDNTTPPAIPDTVITPSVDSMKMETMHWTYYGTITIEKKVTDKPEFVEDAEFTFIIEKRGNWNYKEKEYDYEEVDSVSPVTITGSDTTEKINVETGHYRVTETTVNADYHIDNSNKSQVQEVKKDKNTHYKFTNKYIGPTTGYITITKEIDDDGDQPSTDATFNFLVKRHGGSDHYVTITGEGSATVGPLYPGKTYTVTEVDIPNNYTPDASKKDVLVKVGQNSVTFTNTYKDPTPPVSGSIKITKDIQGDMPPVPADEFTFVISGEGYSRTDYITGEDFALINNLTPGAYTITEVDVPENYKASGSSISVDVIASDTPKEVTFVNIYDAPEPKAHINKTVALYDGANIPSTGFTDILNLTALNQQVIFKIELTCDDDYDGYVSLYDSFHGVDKTNKLQILDGSNLVDAEGNVDGYPYCISLNEEVYHTFYYKDTLPENGTFTNTVNLYEAIPAFYSDGDGESDGELIASSSAVVVVNYSSGGGGGGGGGGGSTHYYEVIYNANYPTGAGISGDVPKDTKDYTYNTTVSVRGNTGDLKAGTYTFMGWNTKADGTGTMYLPGNTFNIKEDTILYAQWKLGAETATTVADPNTGTGDGSAVAAETAKAAGLDDVPKTGTGAPLTLMFLLGLLSLAGITLGRKKILE